MQDSPGGEGSRRVWSAPVGDWYATRWPFRAGVIAAGVAVALLVQRVAIAGNRLVDGWHGALLARLDLATPVLIALAAFVVARRCLDGRSMRWPGIGVVPAIYMGWWLTIVFSVTALHIHPPAGRLAMTAVFFRGAGSPLLGLGAGPLLLSVVLTIALVPLLVDLGRRWFSASRWWVLPLGLGVIALAYRSVCAAAGRTSLFGPLSWLPNQLDLVGVGMALAGLDVLLDHPARRRWLRLGGLVVAIVAFFGRPRSPWDCPDRPACRPRPTSISLPSWQWSSRLACCAAACVVQAPMVRHAPRLAVAAAITAPGVLLAGEAAFTLVARQYHERVFELDGATFLHGNVVAPFVWSLLIGGAFGMAVAAVVGAMPLVAHGEWKLVVRSRLALPAVVAMGFFVRVITLLTVAPERTDGGDPLFYHTTANVLARGRGFPEPLNWIAYEIHRPSAFHGPLYPVMLSISSRFGGTSYFDHKMMSIMIGTAVVLAVGVLGKRLGGPAVGLAAAVFAAVYPNLWLIDSLLYPEGLMALLVTVTMILAYRWRDRPRLATAALFGAAIALTALARGEGILLLPLLALPWMLLTRSLARAVRIRHLLVTVVACAAVLAPWMIRNATTFEKFVPLSTNGNEVMVYANCATAYNGAFVGYWDYQCQQKVREAQGDPPGDESQTALYWRSLGVNYARDHLGSCLAW